MGIRQRKQLLIVAMKARAMACKLEPEVVSGFELMYRRARIQAEQDQVTAAVMSYTEGWKTADDDFSRLLRRARGLETDPFDEDEDHLSPEMEAHIAEARVDVSRKRS